MTVLILSALLAAAAPAERPSVLLVTLDTFRGDFLSATGSKRVTTPNLDELARRGVLFTRARSPIPLTLPAHASILTGLYPPEHGVRDNGSFRLSDEHSTLAEILHAEGYETAAFVAAFVLDKRFGLAQGFDEYDDRTSTEVEALENPEAERPGDEVVAAFRSWLETRDGARPFFVWVHLYDPHAPYEPPEPFRSRYAGDPYAGEIAFTDALVGQILSAVPPSTLIAVVGDHGEGLGDHDETTHALLTYNSTLSVPMILAGPGLPEGRRVSTLARTIDLASTLLDYLGVDQSMGRGKTLRAAIEGRDGEKRSSYSESLYGFYHLGWSPLYGLETERYRFIEAPGRELYDLSEDPGETENVLQDRRPASREHFRLLKELREELGGDASARRDMDAETRARLESLGYLSTTAPVSAAGDLPDPKDEMETYHRIQLGQFQMSRNDCPAAVETLTPLLERAIPAVYETLVSCLLRLGDRGRAETLVHNALDKGLESSRFHVDLGVIAFRGGRLAEAEKELRVAIALDGQSVLAHYHLGDVLRAQRKHEEAIESYREALAINPRYVFAWNGLAMTLARTGANEDALAAFREVVELQPGEPRGYFNLAAQLERMGQRDDALEFYQRFLEISDDTTFARERTRALEAVRRLRR